MDGKVYNDPFTLGGGQFTSPLTPEQVGELLRSMDELPLHFFTHMMHAAQVIGYSHPNIYVREYWLSFYKRAAKALHLQPETEKSMRHRLGDQESQWKSHEAR